MSGLTAALLVVLAVVLARPPTPGGARLAAVARADSEVPHRPRRSSGEVRLAAAVLAGVVLGDAFLAPHGIGAAVGAVAGVGVAVGVGRLEPAAARRRRTLRAAAVPLAADLLASVLAAGAAPARATALVADAIDGPLARDLASVARRLELGQPAELAWQTLLDDPDTAAVARPLMRAERHGTPAAAAVRRAAADLRRGRRWRAAEAAERAGVQALAPLGACFLPAFVLLGVVPFVAGAVRSVVG